MKTFITKLLLILLALACFSLSPAQTQPASTSKEVSRVLSDIELKNKYQNCPSGYYNGPRPGKTHFIKETWLWAVTPEFAQRFCMPPEFVSMELKGAEAVAYKLFKPQGEESCGEQGDPTVCNTRTEHRFEIYYRHGIIPKELQTPYYNPPYLPSAIAIGSKRKELEFSVKNRQTKPKYGSFDPFFREQFGLQSAKNGRVAWPLATLASWIYYEEIFEDIDYLAVEGETGFSRVAAWVELRARRIVITARKPGTTHELLEMPLSDFALVIELPQSMADRVIANDRRSSAHPRSAKPDTQHNH